MAISTARQNGKANATPASMAGASFSVPTPTVAANDNTRTKTRPGDETQILPNNAAPEGDSGSRGKIYGLSTDKTPEQVANDNEAREKSKEKQGTPKQLDLFENGADQNVSREFARNFNNTSITETPNNEASGSSVEHDDNGSESLNDTSQDESEDEQYELPLNLPDNMSVNKIQSIRSELESKGYDLSFQETVQLVQCNFKVKFPWAPIMTNISRGMVEITGWLTGILFTFSGMALSAGLNFIPVAGSILSYMGAQTFSAVGIGIAIITYLSSMFISAISIWLSHKYFQNASDTHVKVSFIRRRAYRYFIKTMWRRVLGMVTPMAGWLLNILVILMDWMREKKETNNLEKIIRPLLN